MSHTAETIDKLMEGMKDPRNALRFKARALVDLFGLSTIERSIVFGRLEKGLKEAPDSQIKKALEILRE